MLPEQRLKALIFALNMTFLQNFTMMMVTAIVLMMTLFLTLKGIPHGWFFMILLASILIGQMTFFYNRWYEIHNDTSLYYHTCEVEK